MGWAGPSSINHPVLHRLDHRPVWRWQFLSWCCPFLGDSSWCPVDRNSPAQTHSTLSLSLRTFLKDTELVSDKAGIEPWANDLKSAHLTIILVYPDDSGRLPSSKIELLYESENNFGKYLLQMWIYMYIYIKYMGMYFLCERRRSFYGKICEKSKKRLNKAKYNN